MVMALLLGEGVSERIFHTWLSLDTDLMLKVSADLELFHGAFLVGMLLINQYVCFNEVKET